MLKLTQNSICKNTLVVLQGYIITIDVSKRN